MNVWDLSIEDRVHKRVLQVILASLLVRNPMLLRQIEEGFASEAALASPEDHDAVLNYGSQFIHGTLFIGSSETHGTLLASAPEWVRLWLEPELRARPDGQGWIRFEIHAEDRIWHLSRDGRAVSAFPTREEAVDAAKKAVALITAAGGHADWHDNNE